MGYTKRRNDLLLIFLCCLCFFFVQLSFPHKYTTFNNEDKKRTQDAMKNEIEFESYFIFSCSFTVVFRFGIVSIWVTFSMIFRKILFSTSHSPVFDLFEHNGIGNEKKTNHPTKQKKNIEEKIVIVIRQNEFPYKFYY